MQYGGDFFFIVSLIFIPLPLVQCRFLFIGVMGVVLRGSCFSVMITVFLIQALFLGYGGVTSLGVNVVIVALPATLGRWLFDTALIRGYPPFGVGVAVGILSASLSLLMGVGALIGSEPAYFWSGVLLGGMYLPIIVIESVIGGSLLQVWCQRGGRQCSLTR